MRDQHSLMTSSTSPPLKKKKNDIVENTDNAESMETEDEDVNDLSFKLEEMEIDKPVNISMNKVSDLMDERVLEKERLREERDQLFKSEKAKADLEKQLVEEEKLEQFESMNKKRKQMLKHQRKKSNKKTRKSETLKVKNMQQMKIIPNIKSIPDNSKHLLREGDVLYVVPGDGCCGPNSAAAFLFGDEVYGPPLRIKMNGFMAKHWHSRYKYITQCSKKHPFERKLGKGKISYTDPELLIDFLTNSVRAAYMWTDSEDLAVIADMYQVKIKVITSRGPDDANPTVNYIDPEPSLKQFAELKDVEMEELVLYHENDCHFNLVIGENSDLALEGSLSHRLNIGPLLDNGYSANDEDRNESEDISEETEKSRISKLEKELKKSCCEKSSIEDKYLSCERELRAMTEEFEKVKLELKDTKEILKLKDELAEKDLDESVTEDESSLSSNNKTPWKSVSKPNNSYDEINKRNKEKNSSLAQSATFKVQVELNSSNM